MIETEIKKIVRVSPDQQKALARLGIITVRDLLYHFPIRYSDIGNFETISHAPINEHVMLYGTLSKLQTKKSFSTKKPMGSAILTDITGSRISILWIHQPYIAKMFQEGDQVKLSGKITENKYGKSLINPEIERTPFLPIDTHNSLFANQDETSRLFGYPIYPETKGISSRWMYHTIQKIVSSKKHEELPDLIPEYLVKKYRLPKQSTALVWIHMPRNKKDIESAQKRFAFEEIFLIQLAKQYERNEYEKLFSYKLDFNQNDITDFINRFPFSPTSSQAQVITAILDDMNQEKPMSRLVEGDVGSGKTFIAATAAYAVVTNRPVGQDFGNLQVAYMAPTEVLATQLFQNFIQYFKHTGISIGLITGSGCKKFPTKISSAQEPWTTISRTQLLKWIKNGEIPIVVGTHALIQKSVDFKDLGLVIIDEQHRFGTSQRMKLAKKEGHAPHYLSMTATPIPRTLALTLYGDLDLSIIDQMPSGRKSVITTIVPDHQEKRNEAYEHIQQEINQGRQVYVICPRIDDPDPDKENQLNLKSVVSEAKRLKEVVFKNARIDIMHSKMTSLQKEKVMKRFSDHEIDILVSTSVIEVGVNIPNASVIIIEGAERFGLAQLHQLRGRVMRGSHQPHCYLFANAKTEKTLTRLQSFIKAKNGFELAELDLAQRGMGDLAGVKQWGISDVAMNALKNIKMVEYARTEAKQILQDNPTLDVYPLLQNHIMTRKNDYHFE